ncbi:ABC transporter ATP-binding protein [Paenibacillaceae bacterium WGS1546]|uniref:ABC transporter ATP-binding protein n=1 Tax=Cohnella sp. WGS1546 TaxID=3366810 RepID=UPI00372D4B47
MLKVDDVTFRYSSRMEPATDRLSFQVGGGTVCGLLGPNGAGKTTAIQLILGLLKPEHGTIKLHELSLRDDPQAYKSAIGYVSGSHRIYDGLTGREYLNFMADMYGVSAARRSEVYGALTEQFQLQPHLHKPIGSCSYGTQQKFFIMGSIVHSPQLWILDEPLTGLDVESAFVLKQLMKEHAEQGHIVLMSSHIMEICEQLCDMALIIKQGKILHTAFLDEQEQQGDQTLEELYLEVIRQRGHASDP